MDTCGGSHGRLKNYHTDPAIGSFDRTFYTEKL